MQQQLRKLRDSICAKKDLPVYFVVTSKTLDEMAQYLPQTLNELEKISGFGKAKIESYGQQFLEIILEYSERHGLASLVHEKSPKRERKADNNKPKGDKVDTKTLSFELYKSGKNVAQIATERGFAIQTIEGHLAHYIRQGEINIEELISREKLVIIEPEVKKFEGGSIAIIKDKLGSSVSFGEIRLTIAWNDFIKSKEGETK